LGNHYELFSFSVDALLYRIEKQKILLRNCSTISSSFGDVSVKSSDCRGVILTLKYALNSQFFLLMYNIKYKEIDQSNLPRKQPVCANWTSNPILFVIRRTGSFRSECVVLLIRILAGATLIIIAPVDLSAGKSGEKLAVPFMPFVPEPRKACGWISLVERVALILFSTFHLK
jgi:hypothetical protein